MGVGTKHADEFSADFVAVLQCACGAQRLHEGLSVALVSFTQLNLFAGTVFHDHFQRGRFFAGGNAFLRAPRVAAAVPRQQVADRPDEGAFAGAVGGVQDNDFGFGIELGLELFDRTPVV